MARDIDERRASLVEVLDRTLRTGVAVRGDIMISVAGVDLVGIDLRVVLAAAGRLQPPTVERSAQLVTQALISEDGTDG